VAKLQWPVRSVGSDDDLAPPLKEILAELNLLELDSKDSTGWDTPFSRQAITAGALAMSKWMGTAIASLGGLGAIVATAAAFWARVSVAERIGYASMAVLLIVGMAVALAVIVRADVTARGLATAAMYRARADVASGFLATTQRILLNEPAYWVRLRADHTWHPVTRFRKVADHVMVEGPDAFLAAVADIEDLEVGPALPAR
jgi:hypothetical protein